MPDLLIENLDDALVARLTENATHRGQSLEEYIREVLTRAGARFEFEQRCMKLQQQQKGAQRVDSTQLIREDRDR